jgi:signal transduction histidine kinase
LEKYAALGDCMGVALHPSQALSVLPPLYSNASCLKQLFEILLDNALKFVSEGGEVWVEVSLRKNRAVFCVRDNGVGIAPEALPHVFERFFKGSHDFNESGSGLGLAIAREIAAGLKEKLWVESEPGKGSAFFFTMRVK